MSINTMLGWTYWQAGKTKQAETELLAVTESKGLYKSEAYNYLAIIYREQGEFVKAEKLYLQAIKIWPGDPVLHKNLGILYELYLGRLNDALSSYKQAQAINDKDKVLNTWVKDLERRT
jgi:Flp pilus assembly protein TadD